MQILMAILGNALTSLFVGSFVTWFVARIYYMRAGDELRNEAARLHKTTQLILRWLENRGENVEVIRDAMGNPTGLRHNTEIVESIQASATLVGGEFKSVDTGYTK